MPVISGVVRKMYQMYIGSRIIGEGYDLVEFADIIVVQGLQISGETVDSYAARPRLKPCPIKERKTPLVQLGRLVIDAIRPYAGDRVSALAVFIFIQILVFTYPFWIVEYRRVQSWNYAVGIVRVCGPVIFSRTQHYRGYIHCF